MTQIGQIAGSILQPVASTNWVCRHSKICHLCLLTDGWLAELAWVAGYIARRFSNRINIGQLCGSRSVHHHHAKPPLWIQIQIRTCRARLTNCPGALTKCQKAIWNIRDLRSCLNLLVSVMSWWAWFIHSFIQEQIYVAF